MLKMRMFYYVIVLLFVYSKCAHSQYVPPNPCPNLFQYLQNNGIIYGRLQFPNDFSGYYELTVNMSVATLLPNQNIRLQLQTSANELVAGRPVIYNIYFPIQDIIPRPTRIQFNGRVYCVGPPEQIGPGRGVTNMWATAYFRVTTSSRPTRPNSVYDEFEKIRPRPLPANTPVQFPVNTPPVIYVGTPSRLPIPIPGQPIKVKIKPNQPSVHTTTSPVTTVTESQSTELHYDYTNDRFNYYSTSWTSKKPVSTTTIGTTTTTRAPTTRPVTTTADPNLFQRLKPFTGGDCGITTNPGMSITDEISASSKGLHPWLAALFLQSFEGLRFACGSTVVSKKHVITAAHCVQNRGILYKSEELLVALGRTNIKRWTKVDGSQIVEANSVHVHPEYKPNIADADIAMITLKKEAIFSNSIRPACMWIGKTDVSLIASSKGTVAGWGTDEFDNILTAEAGQINLPVVSQDVCVRSNAAFEQLTSSRTFCGGNRNNSGPCTGDSGSGFLMKINERWTLRGIVSVSLARKSDGTCDLEQYVVFADVAKFLSWILPFLETSL